MTFLLVAEVDTIDVDSVTVEDKLATDMASHMG
jgi:hypothetical protein